MDNLYYYQGIEKISTLIQECSANTQTGNLIKAAAEGFRIDLGFNTTFGTMNNQDWKKVETYVTNCWYKEIMKFFVTINKDGERLELIEDTPSFTTLRHNDSFIMKEFITAGIDKSKLRLLNYMRTSIEAVTLADIATPNGKQITFNAWNLIGSNDLRSEYDWPRKPEFTVQQKTI